MVKDLESWVKVDLVDSEWIDLPAVSKIGKVHYYQMMIAKLHQQQTKIKFLKTPDRNTGPRAWTI